MAFKIEAKSRSELMSVKLIPKASCSVALHGG